MLSSESSDTLFIRAVAMKSYEYSAVSVDTAILLGKKALEISIEVESQSSEALANVVLGIAHQVKADFYSTLKYYLEALRIYEELGWEDLVIQTKSRCANVYQDTEEYEKALKIRMENLQVMEQDLYYGYEFGNIGKIHEDIENYDTAAYYYHKALDVFSSLEDDRAPAGKGVALKDLAGVFYYLEQPDSLIYYMNEAVDLLSENRLDTELAQAYLILAKTYRNKLGDYEKAYEYTKSANDLAETINAAHVVMRSYEEFSNLFEQSGDYKESLDNYKKYIALQDSILGQEKLNDIALLEAKDNEIRALNENNLLKQKQLAAQARFQNFLLFGIGSIVILLLFLYRNYLINRKQNRELLQKNEEIEIKNEVILKERDNAQRASAIKSQFLTTMSHEIRTPLNAVIGYSHLLLNEKPRDDQAEHLRALSFSGEHLLMLVNDILDFSKFEAGKIEFENVSFNIHEMVEAIKHVLDLKAKEKGISLDVRIDEDVPEELIGDPTRLAQILNNLLGNGVKFTHEGQVELEIAVEQVKQQQQVLRFTITDTGIGIPEEKQQEIFKSFEQVSVAISTKYGGTGLGLAITKKLVETMGGSINVQSEVGVGSTFSFVMPFKVERPEPKPEPKKSQGELHTLRGVKLLVAEDNIMNEMLILQFLNTWEVETDMARNGLEAVEQVQKKDYDLVLMDLQMPEMDGLEASRTIRGLADVKFHELPIIALTASTMQETKDNAHAAGMTDFLSKPFDPNELHGKIKEYSQAVHHVS